MLALSNLRKGYRYGIKNYREYHEVEVIDIIAREDYMVKDVHTLEIYPLSDLIAYGTGPDFDIIEL